MVMIEKKGYIRNRIISSAAGLINARLIRRERMVVVARCMGYGTFVGVNKTLIPCPFSLREKGNRTLLDVRLPEGV
jgi:hypothetical protein